MSQPGTIEPDREQLARFVRGAFLRAEEGGVVSLRAFYDDALARRRNDPPFKIRAVRLNGKGLEPVIEAVVSLVDEAARAKRPVVVCPPIATFRDGKASEKSLLEGLFLSVELDERAGEGLAALRFNLGPPTFVVSSGGEWTDPATGEVQPKLHLHWRLAEPAVTPEEHAKLKRARTFACDLVGADGTSKPAVHGMRWPGSLHRKDPASPRLCRIVEENPGAEVALEHALAELEGLAALRGWAAEEEGGGAKPGADPEAGDDLLAAIAAVLTNPLPPKKPGAEGPEGEPRGGWADWNRIGLAFYRASGGSGAGLAAFDAWSAKNEAKHVAGATSARWEHYRTSPPTSIGAGALVYEARRCDPGFRKRETKPTPEPPEDEATETGPAEPDQDWRAELAAAIEELNGRYFVATMGGRGVIASMVRDDTLGRDRLVFSGPRDVKLLYNHRHVLVGFTQKGNEIWKDLGTAWIEHPRRRTFDRIALLPKGPTPPGVFNLWRGFGVEPAPGGWPLLRDHLLTVVCAGDEDSLRYLLGWCAYCVQHPDRQAEVAVVLRGEKGTGKGTVGQVLARIFRHHALQIVHGRHLTGHFNAHLVDALFLFLDEAFWGGDKQGEGVLKALVTERTIMIEPKGFDPFAMPNRLKIMMASNADWVVPASADERRYFVLDVGNGRQNDFPYFESLHQALDGGEVAAFLADLLAMDLSGFNIRAVPHTRGLNRQKLVGADSVTAFWNDCLREGVVIGQGGTSWPEDVITQVLHACYLEHARDHGERHPASDARMVERLDELWAGCGVRRVRPRTIEADGRRPQRYALASLERHRAAFLMAMRIAPEQHRWPEDGEACDAPG